ncbi:MAG: nickel-type superoxide dismutase maturation protease [Geitlerinemataceae cyanobacterium]
MCLGIKPAKLGTFPDLRSGNFLDLLLWLLRRRRRFRVEGDSMQPFLQPGDEVLVNERAYGKSHPAPGDLIICEHPHRPQLQLIKRAIVIDLDGNCFVRGDNNTASTDSRSFGMVRSKAILGKVVCRFL